jgi:hypothetical protein
MSRRTEVLVPLGFREAAQGHLLRERVQVIPLSEVEKHDKDDDAWTVVHGKVLDISEFLSQHPGGKAVLKQYAGKVCYQLAPRKHFLLPVDARLSKTAAIVLLVAAQDKAVTIAMN